MPAFRMQASPRWPDLSISLLSNGESPYTKATLRAVADRLVAMNAHVDHLLEDALRLSAEERSAVAAALIDSLESADEAAVSEAWRSELLKRRENLRSGRVHGLPWAEVRARLDAL